MDRLWDLPCNPKSMSPQTLAFVGDAVYDLIVREMLCCKHDTNVGTLNNCKVNIVCCQAQAKLVDEIWDDLSEDEKVIYKRGRNAHVSQVPKNATVCEYHKATGLEVLIGYLYLEGNLTRIKQIFKNFISI